MKHLVASTLAITVALASAAPAQGAFLPSDDPVLYWNDLAIGLVGGSPPAQGRIMAILNAAVHDAVNRTYNGGNYYTGGVVAPGGNVRAAAAAAAHRVLTTYNPVNTALYDAALADSLALVANGVHKTNGIATGHAYADAMITLRAGDGSGAVVPYTPGLNPGEWRPTPPGNGAAALPHWGGVTPFLMSSGSQFRPIAPPALNSEAYTNAYNEVKEIGAIGSATRTADQTASALFWDMSNGMTWLRIGVDIVADDGNSVLENARLMAKLSGAIADASISVFDAKYHFNYWRPITAIREGDADGNAATVGDANWLSLFNAPAHPSYSSGHSINSGAAAAVLLELAPDQAFCSTIGPDTRCFTGIAEAALDAANSRMWGGIHFRFDNEMGLAAGYDIGEWVLAQNAFNAVPEPASWALMIGGLGVVGAAMRRRKVRVTFA